MDKNEAETPTTNDDGFEAGGLVSNDGLYKYLAEQRASAAAPKKRGRPPKAAD